MCLEEDSESDKVVDGVMVGGGGGGEKYVGRGVELLQKDKE